MEIINLVNIKNTQVYTEVKLVVDYYLSSNQTFARGCGKVKVGLIRLLFQVYLAEWLNKLRTSETTYTFDYIINDIINDLESHCEGDFFRIYSIRNIINDMINITKGEIS